jgi:hypothetical protein
MPLGARQPDLLTTPQPASPEPKGERPPFGEWAARAGRVLLGVAFTTLVITGAVLALRSRAAPALPAASASATRRPATATVAAASPDQTSTPTAAAPATVAAAPTCLDWSKVSSEDVGKNLCVQGVVKRWFASGDLAAVVIFSEDPGTFIMVQSTAPDPRIKPGSCLQARGQVEIMGGVRPFIRLTEETLSACP